MAFLCPRVSGAGVGQGHGVCWCDRLAMVPGPCPICTMKVEGECKPWCSPAPSPREHPTCPSLPSEFLDLAPLHPSCSFKSWLFLHAPGHLRLVWARHPVLTEAAGQPQHLEPCSHLHHQSGRGAHTATYQPL